MRIDPAVLAATRSDSGAEPNVAVLLRSTFVIVALFLFCDGASSPSVPSSYPEVFPSLARGRFRGRPLGLPVGGLLDARELGRD